MYQEDWLLRQIENMIRTVVRIIFKKDDINYRINEENYTKTDLLYKQILELLKELKINEAENLLFESIDSDDQNYLKIALDFYQRLNKLSDEELEKGNFTREEISLGIEDVLKEFNIYIPYLDKMKKDI